MLIGINDNTHNILNDMAEGAIKNILSSTPIFGMILSVYETNQNRRQKEFITELDQRVSKLEKDQVDYLYLKSEECYDLFNKAHRIRLQHRSKLKAKIICNMLVESVSKNRDPRFDTNIKEIFLSLLADMIDAEIEFLSNFITEEHKPQSRIDLYKENNNKAVAVDILYMRGILKDSDTWDQQIEISKLGQEFVEYLRVLARQD